MITFIINESMPCYVSCLEGFSRIHAMELSDGNRESKGFFFIFENQFLSYCISFILILFVVLIDIIIAF